jgi:Spy/CpxP family protein refolding chaperone
MARGLVFLAALRRLDLTEEQREQVRAKVEAFRERMTDTERPAPEQGEELRDLLTGDEVDRHAIRRLVDEEAEQRFQHLVAIAELSAEVRGVLTEEQREQLDTMRERGAGRGMRTPQGRRGRGLAPQGFGPGTGPGREPGQGMGQGMGPQAGPGRGPQGPRAAAPGPDLW